MKVLHILSSLNGGGVGSLLSNYIADVTSNNIAFEFMVYEPRKGIFEDKFFKNSKIMRVTPIKKSLLYNFVDTWKIISRGKYDVVHCHLNHKSIVPLAISLMCRVPVRIVHSHGCENKLRFSYKSFFYLLRFFTNLLANNYFACGQNSAAWLYGKNYKKKNVYIMPNAICPELYKFKIEDRKKLRIKFGLKSSDKVLIHVGRFSPEKNQFFLIQMIQLLKSELNSDFKLFLVGDGNLKKHLVNMTLKFGLEKNIFFIDANTEVNKYLSMADIFVFPSKHEGFGIALLEAQSSGMLVLSSNAIGDEANISKKIQYLDIEKPRIWADQAICFDAKQALFDRKRAYKLINNSKYDIKTQRSLYFDKLSELTGWVAYL